MPRAGSHYNLGTSRGPDKIGSRAGPGPRAVSCTWLVYHNHRTRSSDLEGMHLISRRLPGESSKVANNCVDIKKLL